MYCLDYDQLSFMLHELVFLGYHLQFASYPCSFTLYPYSCKISQPYAAATVGIHSDSVFSSIGASRMKTVIEINARQQMLVIYKRLLIRIRQPDACESSLIRNVTCRFVQIR